MTKILVTGAKGFLGREVIKKLNLKKWNYVGVSKKQAESNYVTCDLAHPENVLELLGAVKPDVIINLAATVDFASNAQKNFFPVNVLLPCLLSQYCAHENKFLIQSSGIIVHGFSHQLYNLKTPIAPESTYGKSKLLADQVIEISQCTSAILRFGGIFGNDGPAHLGINKAILEAQEGIVPVVVGSGAAKRNYVFVKDAANAIIRCVEDQITGIHYVGGEEKAILEMCMEICDRFMFGQKPGFVNGKDAQDQIVESSDLFEITPFRNALAMLS